MSKRQYVPQHIRLTKFLHALNILREKEIKVFTQAQAVGEIDQRKDSPLGKSSNYDNIRDALISYGAIQCVTPHKSRHKQYKVISWKLVQILLNQLTHDAIEMAMSSLGLSSRGINGTDEYAIESLESEPEEMNGRKPIGWFRRWFLMGDLVEEVRTMNDKLDQLLEVWSE